ncbi:MAG: hypothetical protein WCJ24_00590 [Candidatus Saccharibacteria bacterium]
MPLSEAENELFQHCVNTFGDTAEKINYSPLKIRVNYDPTNLTDLMDAIITARASGDIEGEDIELAYGFIGNIFHRIDQDEVVAGLPRDSEPGAEYVLLQFPGGPEY